MYIHHVSIFTQDPDALAAFFEKYFTGAEHSRYHNEKTGTRIIYVKFPESDTMLEVCSRPAFTLRPTERSRGYAHISMAVPACEDVDRITQSIAADGYTVVSDPRITGLGFYESTVMDHEGNWVEITCG